MGFSGLRRFLLGILENSKLFGSDRAYKLEDCLNKARNF
jgi:hypothetical protein